jgi:hypothetical protein
MLWRQEKSAPSPYTKQLSMVLEYVTQSYFEFRFMVQETLLTPFCDLDFSLPLSLSYTEKQFKTVSANNFMKEDHLSKHSIYKHLWQPLPQ